MGARQSLLKEAEQFEQCARGEASFAADCNSIIEARNWVKAKRSRIAIHLLHETCVQLARLALFETAIICQSA